jgi:hypothetical protein
MRWVALFLLTFLPQDPAEKVRALVEKLGSEEIADREKAAAEIIKLGPSSLPHLRPWLTGAEGERKALLSAVIRKFERMIKKDDLLRGPRIMLTPGPRPVAEVFAEIAKQGRLRIDLEGITSDSKVDVALADVPLWKAIDQVCKAHGRIMYTYSAQRIIIEPQPYREPPRLHHEGVLFFLDHFLLDRAVSDPTPRILLKPVVAWPPGSSPLAYRIETEKFQDDLGTDLHEGGAKPSWIWLKGPIGETLSSPLFYHSFPGKLPDAACTFAVWKGTLRLRFPVDLRPAVSIPNPFAAEKPFDADGDYQLSIGPATLVGTQASFTAMIATPLKDDPDVDYYNLGLANLLVLRDSKGGMIRGEGQTRPGSGAPRKENGRATRMLEFTFNVPAGTVIASLDLMKLEDLEDVEIPFEFRDIKFREPSK